MYNFHNFYESCEFHNLQFLLKCDILDTITAAATTFNFVLVLVNIFFLVE